MVQIEVRQLAKHENPPQDLDHLLIEQTPNGRFSVIGIVEHPGSATFLTTDSFDTLDDAASWASDWARSHNVGVIYVKAGR